MGIGRMTKLLIDKNRTDYYSGEAERLIPISLYYPTRQEGTSTYQAIYSPKEEMLFKIYGEGKPERQSHLASVKTKFINNAVPDRSHHKLPVILFSHGLSADRDFYMFIIEPLCEAGYLVVTCGHLYDTDFTLLPDGRVIEMKPNLLGMSSLEERTGQIECRAEDLKFVADRLVELDNEPEFFGMFDTERMGACGHSLGGMTVLSAMDHPLIKVGVILDAAVNYLHPDKLDKEEVLNKPLLNFRRAGVDYGDRIKTKIEKSKGKSPENFMKGILTVHETALEEETNTGKIFKLFNSNPEDFIFMDKTEHLTFCDWFTLLPEVMDQSLTPIKTAHHKIARVVLAFFAEYLNNEFGVYSDLLGKGEFSDIHRQRIRTE